DRDLRMVMYNGPTETVRYFAVPRISASEASYLRELERAENESLFVGDLLALKRQYVEDESRLEARRRAVLQRLYGAEVSTSSFGQVSGADYGFGGRSLAYAYPYAYGWGWG